MIAVKRKKLIIFAFLVILSLVGGSVAYSDTFLADSNILVSTDEPKPDMEKLKGFTMELKASSTEPKIGNKDAIVAAFNVMGRFFGITDAGKGKAKHYILNEKDMFHDRPV